MKNRSDLEHSLSYTFKDRSLLDLALTHRSATTDSAAIRPDLTNERLEFLGDRVLGLAIAGLLYTRYPTEPEGKLAPRLASLASRETLNAVAEGLSLKDYIEVGESERNQSGDSIAANACEALIGAIYLDGGLAAAEKMIEPLWRPLMEANLNPPKDSKTALQEWAQARSLPLPEYTVTESTGPDHAPHFVMAVSVSGYKPVMGEGPSKRTATQSAAKNMLDSLNDR